MIIRISTFVGYRDLYHLGYPHRNISPGNIVIVDLEARGNGSIVDSRYQAIQGCMHVGRPLITARGADDLARGVLGAMYGECCWKTVRAYVCLKPFAGYRKLLRLGYIHRDISVYNIIIADCDGETPSSSYEPLDIVYEPTSNVGLERVDQLCLTLQKPNVISRGMLIDSNLAIKRGREGDSSPDNPRLTVCEFTRLSLS